MEIRRSWGTNIVLFINQLNIIEKYNNITEHSKSTEDEEFYYYVFLITITIYLYYICLLIIEIY